jgi:hypothetical protein
MDCDSVNAVLCLLCSTQFAENPAAIPISVMDRISSPESLEVR